MQLKLKLNSSAEARGGPFVEGEDSALGPLRVRIVSEWVDCCELSESFGQGSLEWELVEEASAEVDPEESEGNDGGDNNEGGDVPKRYTATYQCNITPNLGERALLEVFNKDAGIYAVIFREVQRTVQPLSVEDGGVEGAEPTIEPQLMPLSFVHVDCSIFLLETENSITSSCVVADTGILAEMEVIVSEPLLPQEEISRFEPLILDIGNVSGFPILEGELPEDALKSMYMFGNLDIGGVSVLRKIYLRPKSIGQDSDGKQKIAFNYRVCILPGLIDLPRFKESLTSSTYTLELYHEQLYDRAFHINMIEDYHQIFKDSESGASPSQSPLDQSNGQSNKADLFLLSQIGRALDGSSRVTPHGNAPFRLEQLLSSAQDLLKEFARRRKGQVDGDENVVVKEDIISEVRLCRPSNPLKWKTPDDMSLRSAMNKVRGLKTIVKRKYVKPRHERFDDEGTVVSMSVELHRQLKHPKFAAKITQKLSESFSQSRFDATVQLSEEENMLKDQLQLTPFGRMVFALKFDDDETLLKINEAINKVNSTTLCDIQGSLRSYSFTDEEMRGCTDGTLDVITGFMVIDDDMRLVVVEGLAAPGCGMQKIFTDIPRFKSNDNALKILANPEVLFPTRLYGTFGPDLKRIRIRNKLRKLARKPELYNRKQVELACFGAVDNVMSLKWAPDLLSTKELELYPIAESLNKVELLYGEAISRADLDGTAAEAQRMDQMKATKALREARRKEEDGVVETDDENAEREAAERAALEMMENSGPKRIHTFERNPPTDCHNSEFEDTLRGRPDHRIDFLAEQKQLLQSAYEEGLRRAAHRDAKGLEILEKVLGPEEAATGKIYVYASQAENFKVKAFTELRGRIATVNDGATYTFSKDFISQTVCVVDEDADRKKIKAAAQSHWLTQSGFQYPKPKTLIDLITHPKRPSDSRIEELLEPFAGDVPQDSKSGSAEDVQNLKLERGYSTRIRGGDNFGSLKPAEFVKPFELKLVGNRTTLPRGGLTGGDRFDKDPKAFRSVHLGGEGQAKIIEEAAEKEKTDWADKVVVDSLSVKIDGFCVRDKTYQFERANDILHGEPQRKELKYLRTRKSIGGRDFSYAPPPLSITSVGEFVDNQAAKSLLRGNQPDKFTKTKEGETKDFVRFIDRNANAARVMCILSNKKHPALDPASNELSGPRWSKNAASMIQTHKVLSPTDDYIQRKAQAAANKAKAKPK